MPVQKAPKLNLAISRSKLCFQMNHAYTTAPKLKVQRASEANTWLSSFSSPSSSYFQRKEGQHKQGQGTVLFLLLLLLCYVLVFSCSTNEKESEYWWLQWSWWWWEMSVFQSGTLYITTTTTTTTTTATATATIAASSWVEAPSDR